jgi:hypothetical protein
MEKELFETPFIEDGLYGNDYGKCRRREGKAGKSEKIL